MSRSWSAFSPSSWTKPTPSSSDIRTGSRITIDDCTDTEYKSTKQHIFSSNRYSRPGILLDPHYKVEDETYYIIAIDDPLNTTPTALETNLAPSFLSEQISNPHLHLLAIPLHLVSRRKVIVKHDKFEYSKLDPTSLLMCQLEECMKCQQNKRILHTCTRWKHYLCVHHLVPWDFPHDCPDMACTAMYHQEMVSYSSKQGRREGEHVFHFRIPHP